MSLRIALFVEGSQSPPQRGLRPLERIWNVDLAEALSLQQFSQIIPISKKHLVAMDPRMPAMSGAGEGLDQLLMRTLQREPFDAAIVAWDLIPAWDDRADLCRWQETLDFYRLLGESSCLEDSWRERAATRFHELSTRPVPRARSTPPKLLPCSILALCMEPMFEELLVFDENAIKRALDLVGQRLPRQWPGGWGRDQGNYPDRVLSAAISALRTIRPPLQVSRQVRGDMRTNKDGWGEYLLRKMLEDDEDAESLLEHSIVQRLAELMGR